MVEVSGKKLLFDCGPATTHKLVKAGISPTEVDDVFFTHHHFDHDSDFPTFILTRWDQNIPVDRTLNVYGPLLTDRFTNGIIDEDTGLFAHDWLARVHHPASQATYQARGGQLPRRKPKVVVREIGPGDVVDGDGWRVLASHAEHVQPYLDSLAYRVEAEGRSVVLTGDTRPCPPITELARGAGVLMMMCWETHARMSDNEELSSSSSIRGAAQTAAEAGVKQLVMVHVGPRLREPKMAAARDAEAAEVFDGQVVWGEELMEIALA